MKRLLLPLVALLLPLLIPTPVMAINDAEAVNISGRQRMLTQRMMKNHLLIGAEIQTDKAQRQLDEAVALFEEQLLMLRDYSPTAAIDSKLDTVEALWFPHRLRIISAPSKTGASLLMEDNLALLKACDDVVKAIEAHSGIDSARLVNLSGRQRMLSQRLTQLYMLWAWGIESAELRSEMDRAKNEFVGAQKELSAAKENNPRIDVLLAEVERQWIVFDKSYRLNNGEYIPLLVALSSEKILKAMHEATGLYASLSAR